MTLLILWACARPVQPAPAPPPPASWECERIQLAYGPMLSCVSSAGVRCIVADPDEGPASCVAAVGGGR